MFATIHSQAPVSVGSQFSLLTLSYHDGSPADGAETQFPWGRDLAPQPSLPELTLLVDGTAAGTVQLDPEQDQVYMPACEGQLFNSVRPSAQDPNNAPDPSGTEGDLYIG